MTPSEKPPSTEYAPYYVGYVSTVPDGNIIELLEKQESTLRAYAGRVPAGKETFRYAAGKWTIREMFGHLADAERVFGYRLLCISRGDHASLPGFDEHQYVVAATFNTRPLQSLVDEFALVRQGNLALLKALDAGAWQRAGVANNTPVSVRALAYILAGHVNHHMNMLRTRYDV